MVSTNIRCDGDKHAEIDVKKTKYIFVGMFVTNISYVCDKYVQHVPNKHNHDYNKHAMVDTIILQSEIT